jgi:transposase
VLVMPEVNTAAMQEFLDQFSRTIPEDEHVAHFADQAGWHVATALKVPANISLLALPPYSPEMNPVERIWLYLKERYLSHRLLDDYEAIVDAACNAWLRLTTEAGRLASLTGYPWIEAISS